jgi:hypothetical protein
LDLLVDFRVAMMAPPQRVVRADRAYCALKLKRAGCRDGGMPAHRRGRA